MSQMCPQCRFRITDKDIRMLELLAAGMSNKELAAALHYADSTVKNRLNLIFKKLGAHDRLQAVLMAQATGLINVSELAARFVASRQALDDAA